MSTRQRGRSAAPSPLRLARTARSFTLEQVCAALDVLSENGSSGVTSGMLSGWERDRHVTSLRYRRMLADFYKQPPDELFAHQDEKLTATAETPRLLVGHQDLQDAMTDVVRQADQCLVVTGSRSRDRGYLHAIETALAENPDIVHYRVLFGPPHHEVLREHLLRLLELRDPADRSQIGRAHV